MGHGRILDPLKMERKMVGAAGLEPATLCLEGKCSIRLSYAPIVAPGALVHAEAAVILLLF